MATTRPITTRTRTTRERYFYGAMAATILVTVFVGFSPTYYLLDSFSAVTPLVHLHAAIFSSWVLLFCAQTSLIAARRPDLHRRLGVAGLVLAPLIIVVGAATTIAVAKRISAPPMLAPPGGAMLALINLMAFAVIAGLGLAKRRRAQEHKRLLLIATINLTIAAVNRLPLPQLLDSTAGRFLAADLLLLPLILWDLRTRGRLHPMTVLGVAVTLANEALQLLLHTNSTWNRLARWIVAVT